VVFLPGAVPPIADWRRATADWLARDETGQMM